MNLLFETPQSNPPRADVFCGIFGASTSSDLITNLRTHMTFIDLSTRNLPVSISDSDRDANCYIVSPTTAYVDYAKAELKHFIAQGRILALLTTLVAWARPVVKRSGLDRQVQLNNWLLSTNPPPRLDVASIKAFVAHMTDAFPYHALVIRSLNTIANEAEIQRLADEGFEMLAARQVYLFDCRSSSPRVGRDERRDLGFLLRGDLKAERLRDISDVDAATMAVLYNKLYLEKYTELNPKYTHTFIREMSQRNLLELWGVRLKNCDELVGFLGFFTDGDMQTVPLIGYDTALPAKHGIYRALMAIASQRARQLSLLFNMSAGAGLFKRNRGGVAAIEYTAVYVRHMSRTARVATRIIRLILKHVGEPAIRRLAP
jgi:hypothetical protein